MIKELPFNINKEDCLSLRSGSTEVVSGSLEVGGAHHIVAVLELGAGLHTPLLHLLLLLRTHHHHAALVHRVAESLGLRLVVPLDLELGHSRLLHQDVADQTVDQGLLRRILGELGLLVIVVHIVSNSEEFLVGV
jgi:hypothetical protein